MQLWYNTREVWIRSSSGGSDMRDLRRKLLSQNFLYNRKLVSKLLESSSVGKNDLVLEIGPGKGIITEGLVSKAQHVIAVELDTQWYRYLQDKFKKTRNITLYNQDFLDFSLPAISYKVFANIPFSIERKIIRKLIDDKNPPEDCYLVVMKELAFRLSAPYKENSFSVAHKPWFDFSIAYHFQRTDFTPWPDVDAVLFRFQKKSQPLLPIEDKQKYQRFIEQGFGQGLPIFQNLKKYYPPQELDNRFQKLSVNRKVKPSHIKLGQWIKLYQLLARTKQ